MIEMTVLEPHVDGAVVYKKGDIRRVESSILAEKLEARGIAARRNTLAGLLMAPIGTPEALRMDAEREAAAAGASSEEQSAASLRKVNATEKVKDGPASGSKKKK